MQAREVTSRRETATFKNAAARGAASSALPPRRNPSDRRGPGCPIHERPESPREQLRQNPWGSAVGAALLPPAFGADSDGQQAPRAAANERLWGTSSPPASVLRSPTTQTDKTHGFSHLRVPYPEPTERNLPLHGVRGIKAR